MTYLTIGLIEAVIPMYSAESESALTGCVLTLAVAPAPLRGFFAGLFVPIQSSVGMLTSGVARAFATEQGKIGWLVPVSLQGIPSILGLVLIWFTVESPRWLLSKGRREEAVHALTKLRNKKDLQSGIIEAEIDALEQAIAYDATLNDGTWREVLSGPYWRRALVSLALPRLD